jgi:hypothetical protein
MDRNGAEAFRFLERFRAGNGRDKRLGRVSETGK